MSVLYGLSVHNVCEYACTHVGLNMDIRYTIQYVRFMCATCIKVKAYVYHSYILANSADFMPTSAHFMQLKLFIQYQSSFHLVPITVGWPEAVWIQCLSKAFTHDRRLGNRTSGPLDLGLTS